MLFLYLDSFELSYMLCITARLDSLHLFHHVFFCFVFFLLGHLLSRDTVMLTHWSKHIRTSSLQVAQSPL